MGYKEIKRNGYTIEVSEPEVYVDNQARNRSGHMSHAMTEFKPGCFIEFNSNCSATRCGGHSAFGWTEYRISRDAGKTSPPGSSTLVSTSLKYVPPSS